MKLTYLHTYIKKGDRSKRSKIVGGSLLGLILTGLVALFGPYVVGLVHASFASWGDSSLIHACVDGRGKVTIVTTGGSCNGDETQTTWLKDVDAGSGLTVTRSSSGATIALASSDGWTDAGETWTYASADAPTYTFTISGDKTGKYSPGMRLKLTQSATTKYFLVTGVSYSNPNTTVTVYGGTDYTLANSTISSPYFSMQKAPLGFPMSPAKWTVSTAETAAVVQSSPSQNTWYNVDSFQMSIPVGLWDVSYNVSAGGAGTTNGAQISTYTTLSTSSSSESDNDFTVYMRTQNQTASSVQEWNVVPTYKEKTLSLTSKTTYYLNLETDVTNMQWLGLVGNQKHEIKAVSAYL